MMKFLSTISFLVILLMALSIIAATTKAGEIKFDFENANQLKEWECVITYPLITRTLI